MGFVQNLFPQRYTDALCMIAGHKSLDELENFFDDDMDIDNHHSEIDCSALVFASLEGKIENVNFLLSKGAMEVQPAILMATKTRDDYSSGKLSSSSISSEQKIKELNDVIFVLGNFQHRSFGNLH